MVYKFEAIIQKHPGKDATFIEIPFDVEEILGSKRVKVKAKFDAVEYRGSIIKMLLSCYMIGITKAIRNKIGKEVGDFIIVEIEKDDEKRVVELSEDFKVALEKNKLAKDFYETLSYSGKRKYIQWITNAKKFETRDKRINETIIRLENNIKI